MQWSGNQLISWSLLATDLTFFPRVIPRTWDHLNYYPRCFIVGGLTNGVVNMLFTPVDMVKVRMQAEPKVYCNGFRDGIRQALVGEGSNVLVKAWSSLLATHSAHGFFRFGLYEVFRDAYKYLICDQSTKTPLGGCFAAAMASEFLASIVLCPMDMTKIRVQASARNTFPTYFTKGWWYLAAYRRKTLFPFGKILPTMARQLPFTASRFLLFEVGSDYVYSNVVDKESTSWLKQIGVSYGIGFLSGALAALITHPADTLMTLSCIESNQARSFAQITKETGFKNLLTRGLGLRMFIVGSVSGLQWFAYDGAKAYMGMSTPGEAEWAYALSTLSQEKPQQSKESQEQQDQNAAAA